MRTRHWSGSEGRDTRCPLCGGGPETLAHLHAECKIAHRATTAIATYSVDTDIRDNLTMASADSFNLLEPLSPLQCLHLVAFSHAVWTARNLPVRQDPVSLVKHIKETFQSHLAASRPKTRNPRNRSSEKQDFLALANTLPKDALTYFTDGSSLGNPGPSGAGAICDYQDQRIYSQAKALGTSTNNVAELEGLLMALTHAISWCRGHKRPSSSKPPPPVHIFCDNRYALGVADGKWNAKAHRPLVTQIQSTLASLRLLTTVLLLWVPGHADVEGNEVADRLAKDAALSTHPGLTPAPPLPLHPPLLAPPTCGTSHITPDFNVVTFVCRQVGINTP